MDPWQTPVFQGWNVLVFPSQEDLDLYTALSESTADQRNQEQVKNEETAGTDLKQPVTHNHGVSSDADR